MANRQRGYVPVKIGGEEYLLRYDFDALARLDQALGQSFLKALEVGGISFHVVREALRAGFTNQANGRNAVKALQNLEVGQLAYYLDCILSALEAAGVIKKTDENDEPDGDSEGETTAP